MRTAPRCSGRPRRPARPSWRCRRWCRSSTRCRCSAPARPTMSRPPLWHARLRRPRSARLREAAVLIDVAATPVRSEGVVLLHGIGRTHRWLWKLERALQQAGFATLNLDYASRKKPLELLAADIDVAVRHFAEETSGPLHFVGHSMGGLLARVYIAKYRPERLGRVVMLGTPNGGSEIADRLHDRALYRAYYGPAGQQLTTRLDSALTSLPPPDYDVGVIAGNRSIAPVASLFRMPKPN